MAERSSSLAAGVGHLQARGVSLRRGRQTVLHDIELNLQPASLTILTGPNGAGKSSLLGLLAGLLVPSRGTVSLDGIELQHWSPSDLAQRRAMLTQQSRLEFGFSAEQVVLLGRSPHAVPASAARERQIVEQAMHAARADDLIGRPYPHLSGGEQKRVQLARVLAQVWPAGAAPAWILLDEPEAALDVAHQHGLMRLLQTLARQGYGVVAAVHDLSLAARYADQVVLLQQGRQMACGTPDAVLAPQLIHAVYGIAARRLPAPQGWYLWID